MLHSLSDILVAVDLDNTLLRADVGIPQRNIDAVQRFIARGGRFTIASGRTPEGIATAINGLPISAPVISYNGGVVYDFAAKRRLVSHTLPKENAMAALLAIQQNFPGVGIEILPENGLIYIVQASEGTNVHVHQERLTYVVSPVQNVPGEWNKVLFAAPPEVILQIQAFCKTLNSDGMYFVATNAMYFEIMPKGVGKGNALRELCDILHLSIHNTMAIGDYYNDVDIMKAAGYSVAMGNAPQDVKAVADSVTGDCLSGGVADVLEDLMCKAGALHE